MAGARCYTTIGWKHTATDQVHIANGLKPAQQTCVNYTISFPYSILEWCRGSRGSCWNFTLEIIIGNSESAARMLSLTAATSYANSINTVKFLPSERSVTISTPQIGRASCRERVCRYV